MAVSSSFECVLKRPFDVPLIEKFQGNGRGFATEEFFPAANAMHNAFAEPNVL